jgi:dipeptidyl aminopeptidase/acylaminoacyl peptidase
VQTAFFPSLDPHVGRGIERFVRWGLNEYVATDVLQRLGSAEDRFAQAWAGEAERWEAKADEANSAGRTVTADLWRRQAFWCFRVVDFAITDSTPEKLGAYEGTLRTFAALHTPGVRTLEVTVDGQVYPALLFGSHLPDGGPGAVFIYGADGNKEEHYWASGGGLSARGVKVLVVDGPGQGYALRKDGIPARHDYEAVGSAAFDVLVREGGVDPSRVGLVGSSMGGYYAPRVFARDRRFSALVLNSALHDVISLWDFYPPIAGQLIYNVQAGSPEEARERYKAFDLSAVGGDLRDDDRPALVVHGSDDIYVPASHAEKVAALLGSRCEVRIIEGATHNLGNVAVDVIPQMWDWLVDRLVESTASA